MAAGKPAGHLRDMLVHSITRPVATVGSLELREEDSLTRMKGHVKAASAIVAERGGKGVHKGIQEAIRGIERELAVLRDCRSRTRVARAEVAEPRRDVVAAIPERPPLKRSRTEATPEKADSSPVPTAEVTVEQDPLRLVLTALGKVQADLMEQGKAIANLAAENRKLQDRLGRPQPPQQLQQVQQKQHRQQQQQPLQKPKKQRKNQRQQQQQQQLERQQLQQQQRPPPQKLPKGSNQQPPQGNKKKETTGQPPPAFVPIPGQTQWVEVVKRGRKRAAEGQHEPKPAARAKPSPLEAKVALVRRRVPQTSAVIIDRPTGEGVTLTAIMKRVTSRVDITAIGVKVRTTRITKAGGVLLEVEDAAAADKLAESVRAVVGVEARVSRPERRTPVLLLDVPDWCEEADVESGLSRAGLVRGDYAKDGAQAVFLRRNPGGRGDTVARINVTYTAALKLAGARSVVVGWTVCRVRLLEKSRPTCFRCREQGHIAATCKAAKKVETAAAAATVAASEAAGGADPEPPEALKDGGKKYTAMEVEEDGRPESPPSADQSRDGAKVSTN